MRNTKILTVVLIASCLMGCSNRELGTAVGATSGFLLGSAISGDPLVGAAIGTAVGATAGNLIGSASENSK